MKRALAVSSVLLKRAPSNGLVGRSAATWKTGNQGISSLLKVISEGKHFSQSIQSLSSQPTTTPTTSSNKENEQKEEIKKEEVKKDEQEQSEEGSTSTQTERPLTEEELLKKKRIRIALMVGAVIASIVGGIGYSLFQISLETQNLGVFSDMVETLYLNNDPQVINNAILALEDAFEILDDKKYTSEELEVLKSVFGDFTSVKDSIKLLGPNFVEQVVHRLYLLCKDVDSSFNYKLFHKESRLYYFFPVVNKETGSVAVLKVTFLVDERHTAELKRLREKTRREMEEKEKKQREEKIQRKKWEQTNKEREKKGEPPLEEPKKVETKPAEPTEDKPIEVPPIDLESIHLCDAAPLVEAFEENFFAQHDNYHLYGLKELSHSWPFGASYAGGKSEMLLYKNPKLPAKKVYLVNLLGAFNIPCSLPKIGFLYLENIPNDRIKLDARNTKLN